MQEEVAQLERVCERDFNLSVAALHRPMEVLAQALLHALLLCLRMLVAHPVRPPPLQYQKPVTILEDAKFAEFSLATWYTTGWKSVSRSFSSFLFGVETAPNRRMISMHVLGDRGCVGTRCSGVRCRRC